MAKVKLKKSNKYSELTERQELIYDFICKYINEHPYPPTVREIQRHLKIKSTSTVQYDLDALHKTGYIIKSDGKMRSIEIKDSNNEYNFDNVMMAPVVGSIAAGEPILADQHISDYIPLPSGSYSSADEIFVLEVKGTSMIDVGILDGDYVIVKQCEEASNGEIIAALIDDSATVKRFYRESDHIRLQPENKEMEPIIVKEDIRILGKVVGLYRNRIH